MMKKKRELREGDQRKENSSGCTRNYLVNKHVALSVELTESEIVDHY